MDTARLPRFGFAVLLLALAVTAPARAVEPEVLASRAYDVRVDRSGGAPVLVIEFALALSEVSTYPVTITAIAGDVEEELYNASLPEGIYRLRVAPKRITRGPVRVVLRTRVINRSERGNDTFLVYQRWEGSL